MSEAVGRVGLAHEAFSCVPYLKLFINSNRKKVSILRSVPAVQQSISCFQGLCLRIRFVACVNARELKAAFSAGEGVVRHSATVPGIAQFIGGHRKPKARWEMINGNPLGPDPLRNYY